LEKELISWCTQKPWLRICRDPSFSAAYEGTAVPVPHSPFLDEGSIRDSLTQRWQLASRFKRLLGDNAKAHGNNAAASALLRIWNNITWI
jgi:hypothetical protein